MAAKTRRGAAPEYVSGTAARKLEPERRQERPREPRREASSQSRTVTVRRNQEKALQMDLPYVIVLTIAAVCTPRGAAADDDQIVFSHLKHPPFQGYLYWFPQGVWTPRRIL